MPKPSSARMFNQVDSRAVSTLNLVMPKKGTKRVGNYPIAKYIYKENDKHPYEYRVCPTCQRERLIRRGKTFCSVKCSRMGELNPRWSGDSAQYLARHQRVYAERGQAKDYLCSFCGSNAKEWAYIHDDNPLDVYSYMPLCKRCHARYDAVPHTHCKRGHLLSEDNVYRQKSGGRQCKTCSLARAKLQRGGQ